MGWDGIYLRSLVLKEHRQSDAKNTILDIHIFCYQNYAEIQYMILAKLYEIQYTNDNFGHPWSNEKGHGVEFPFISEKYIIGTTIASWSILKMYFASCNATCPVA